MTNDIFFIKYNLQNKIKISILDRILYNSRKALGDVIKKWSVKAKVMKLSMDNLKENQI